MFCNQLMNTSCEMKRLEQFGDEFLRSKEYRLALAECYSRFLHTPVEKRTGGKLQAQDDQVHPKTPLTPVLHIPETRNVEPARVTC